MNIDIIKLEREAIRNLWVELIIGVYGVVLHVALHVIIYIDGWTT